MAPSLPITERQAHRLNTRGPLRQWAPPVLTQEVIAIATQAPKSNTRPADDGFCGTCGPNS
jgi:hypothetical protein